MIGSLPQQANAIQKVCKIDVVRALYSQVSFAVQRMKGKSLTSAKSVYAVSVAVQRMKWKSFTSPKSVYAVSARTLGLVPG